jgi:hypothetical protein
VGTRAPAVAKDADAECAAGPANESKTYPSIDSIVKELSAQYINDMKKLKLVENGAVGEKDPYEIALEKIQEHGDVDIRAAVGERFEKAIASVLLGNGAGDFVDSGSCQEHRNQKYPLIEFGKRYSLPAKIV